MKWQRLKEESTPAWTAAKTYFEMGPQRTLKAVAKKLKKSATIAGRWSGRYKWIERAKAWDAEQEEIATNARNRATEHEAAKWAKRRIQVQEQAWEDSLACREVAKKILALPITRKTVSQDGKNITIEPVGVSPYTAFRGVEVSDRLARLATGMNTEKVEHTGPDGKELPVAQGQIVILKIPDNGRDKPFGEEKK